MASPQILLESVQPPGGGVPGRTDEEIREEFTSRFRESREHLAEWRVEAKSLYEMVAGRQWDAGDVAKLEQAGRPFVTFNLIAKFLDMVVGLQIANRQEVRYYPREPGDTKRSEMLTAAAEFARELCDAQVEETDAFHDALLTGLGWVEWYLDEVNEPAKLPAGERRDPLEMYFDPCARKRGLTDRRWQARLTRISPQEYRDQFDEEPPTEFDEDLLVLDDDLEVSPRHIPANHDYPDPSSPTALNGRTVGRRIPVADYQWWTIERGTRAMAYLPGVDEPETQFFTRQEWPRIEAMLLAQGVQYEAVDAVERRFWRAFITPTGVKRAGPSLNPTGFTIHPITGKRDRNCNSWYGIGRALVDPQRWTNKFFSSILFTLMVNAKGGLIAEESAFANVAKAEESWASPESITLVRDGALSQGRIEQKPAATYPTGMDRLMQFSMESLPAVSGLNLEIMGLADRVQPGIVEAQRKQSAMAIIAWAFDAMRLYNRHAGRQIATYIARYTPENTLVRINGDNGMQYVPLQKDALSVPFDIVVDEAPTSVNMKERVWLALESLLPKLMQLGVPIPKEVLDYSPLPADLAAKWKESMQPDPQRQEQEQRLQAGTIRKLEGEAAEKEASAKLKAAQAEKAGAETATEQMTGLEAAAKAGRAQAGEG